MTFFHTTSTAFSVRINIFKQPLKIFCRADDKSKQIWRKSPNHEAALQNQNKLSSTTTKNQNKCGKNLLILKEKNCRGCVKKMSIVTETVNTFRKNGP